MKPVVRSKHNSATDCDVFRQKIYYDLATARDAAELWDTEIVRIEQLYPFRKKHFTNCWLRHPTRRLSGVKKG